jgi:hypothetical protein
MVRYMYGTPSRRTTVTSFLNEKSRDQAGIKGGGEWRRRGKIRLIEGNAKCRHLKKIDM